ncbi:hypothetical protein PSNTI_01920 [Stutzerimonas stutzeri]|nr:hypothetical protein PSNTI_01920 [Stutzerimonas stutzeri]
METGQAVNGLVLSGARRLVLSGAPVSCYQARKSPLTSMATSFFSALNFISNLNTLLTKDKTLLLGRWITTDHRQHKRFSSRSSRCFPPRRAAS